MRNPITTFRASISQSPKTIGIYLQWAALIVGFALEMACVIMVVRLLLDAWFIQPDHVVAVGLNSVNEMWWEMPALIVCLGFYAIYKYYYLRGLLDAEAP